MGDTHSITSYRCGAIEIDALQRQVLIAGARARIGARAFDVLLALVERRERVVSKHELMDLVWPKLVVEENNLLVHLVALRKVLGPFAIVTVPGRGYRFAMPVEGMDGDCSSKDLPIPESVEGAETFPPLSGRPQDQAKVEARMHERMILSITHPDGIGTTRLALSAAVAAWCELPDGRWWMELEPIRGGAQIPRSVARMLRAQEQARGSSAKR